MEKMEKGNLDKASGGYHKFGRRSLRLSKKEYIFLKNIGYEFKDTLNTGKEGDIHRVTLCVNRDNVLKDLTDAGFTDDKCQNDEKYEKSGYIVASCFEPKNKK